ncbi:iron-siderophore ABC transporter substrate-binding protein [Pimelobacter simplex]|uniref:iron-siderophore ABC transporter substrate-binding protein n=1 Tax=Nocardioides simplex TaxID=2045 RepID=UPI003AACC6C0
MSSRIRRVLALAVALAVGLTLAACGSKADDASDRTGGGGAAGAFPVTVDHVFGSTTIPSKPRRVVTIGWITHDIVAALGVVPVGVPKTWGGDDEGFTPWFRTQVEDVLDADLPQILTEGEEPDFEQILGLQPDLILAPHSGITENQYKRLSEIAPTVAYAERPWVSGSWRDLTQVVATALGEQDRATELIAQTQTAIDTASAAHPALAGTSFLYGVSLSDGATELGVYVAADPRVAFLREFGLVDSPSLGKALGTIGKEDFYGAASLEVLDTIETDLFVGWSASADETRLTLEHPSFSRWAPIADGHYYVLQDDTMAMATNGPNLLSIPWAIDEGFVDDLAKAVDGGAVVRATP